LQEGETRRISAVTSHESKLLERHVIGILLQRRRATNISQDMEISISGWLDLKIHREEARLVLVV